MPDLILHHYPMSPYAHKIRAMLGYTHLPWQSAITREMPPRPVVDHLTGGYGRIPVAQIGADIFCDSNLIAEEIAQMTGHRELSLHHAAAEVQAFVQHVQGDIFFASVTVAGGKTLRKKVMAQMRFLDLLKLVFDRVQMARKAKVPMPAFRETKTIVRNHLQDMEQRLQQDFLFSNTPNIADFAAYHSLWFIRDVGEQPWMNDYPRTIAWMNRLRAFGEGKRTEIKPEQALGLAAVSTPRAIPREHTQHANIGKAVCITPADYRLVPVAGHLVGVTDHSWIVARRDKEAGQVHVHFPRQGYLLERV